MPGWLLMEESVVVVRALVVQSRSDVARAVTASLAAEELEAIVVGDGPAAVALLDTAAVDVVLVDLTLPPLDGWYVLAAVGARTDRPLLVVRVADASEADRAIALGADAWVDDDVHVVAAAGRLVLAVAA
jgi:DNA-binding response OmpR family regulator